jgi:YidC/Oxa1 family membrane protein insertase
MNIINLLLVQPIVNILLVCYHALVWAHVPYDFGFSIILLTILLRFLLYPIVSNQLKMSKKMQELAPLQAKIKEKYKGDMKQQQQAQLALYREHGVNPAAGCLPGAIQIAILLFGLYPTLRELLTLHGKALVSYVNNIAYAPWLHISQPFDMNFFGYLLDKTPGQLFHTMPVAALLVPVITGILQLLQSKMMMPVAPKKTVQQIKDPNTQEDFMAAFQKQSLYLLPFMIGIFSFQFFVGLSLYWNTYSIFGIIQQYRLSGWGSLSEWMLWKKSK